MTLYHYPGCSTCRKARKLLIELGAEATLVDLVATPPDAATLRQLWERSGQPLKKLFNTSGQSYRGGGFKDRLPAMSEDDQLAALAADGKLVKRPILVLGASGPVLIGLREPAWREALAAG